MSMSLLLLELAALFVALPAALALGRPPPFVLLPAMWLATGYALWRLARDGRLRAALAWRPGIWRSAETRAVLRRFALLTPVLAAVAWLVSPENFLGLPRAHPLVWLLLVALYPVLSVWPQEILYRVFFFHRYEPLLGGRKSFAPVAASALLFGAMHLVFHNLVAPALTVLGGLMFAATWRRTGSLWLVCLEHWLWGAAALTLGFHRYFFATLAWLDRR
jgi:membrane protease YdiL (CAAX protease family)